VLQLPAVASEKNVTVVRFDHHLGTAVWPLLKEYMVKQNSSAADEIHYMCNYCKQFMRKKQKASAMCAQWVACS